VMAKPGVDDCHDNPSLAILADGRLLVAVSGRNTKRPGALFRSLRPYDHSAFERIESPNFTYPQPWVLADGRLVMCLTRYTAGRELYVATADAAAEGWSEPRKLVGFGGHYALSAVHGSMLVVVCNWHPDGNVDRRTNLYALASPDAGQTWFSLGGERLEMPLAQPDNPALVRDFAAEDTAIYLKDLVLDADGRPWVLVVARRAGDPQRSWLLGRLDRGRWRWSEVTTSDHDYDTGCLWLEGGDAWVLGPSLPGAQPGTTGGDLALLRGRGDHWRMVARITADPGRNHSYVRRPLHARPDFAAFWGAAHSEDFSPVQLHCFDAAEGKARAMPLDMPDRSAVPQPLPRPR
jgi:hypothetical protein